MDKTLKAIKYDCGKLEVLNQLLLPFASEYILIRDVQSGWDVINSMQVRGAPAIAVTACLSLAVELRQKQFSSKAALSEFIKEKLELLLTSRPTAVNLKLSADRLTRLAARLLHSTSASTAHHMKLSLLQEIEGMLEKDVSDNKSIGEHGAEAISEKGTKRVTVLTHCNTGSLATAGYGTALGVIRTLHARHLLNHVYFTETRPYMQGSRLTAYELNYEGIPATLVCDSAVSALLKTTEIDAIVVGADRVAANGDTANKIGTYQIGVSGKHHGVPFYVAAPLSSIDFSTTSGEEINLEVRDPREMTQWKDVPIVPPGVECWNIGFDVTPSSLITGGIITEKGVVCPHQLASLTTH